MVDGGMRGGSGGAGSGGGGAAGRGTGRGGGLDGGLDGEVRRFVASNFIVDVDAGALPGSTSLTEAGVLDSMGVLELVLFLEERYGLTVADDELIPENLDTLDRIVAFLGRKLAAQGRGDEAAA